MKYDGGSSNLSAPIKYSMARGQVVKEMNSPIKEKMIINMDSWLS